MKCKKCSAENEGTSKYCYKCGERLAQTLICAKCDKPLKPEAKFCNECGTQTVYSENTATSRSYPEITNQNLDIAVGLVAGSGDKNEPSVKRIVIASLILFFMILGGNSLFEHFAGKSLLNYFEDREAQNAVDTKLKLATQGDAKAQEEVGRMYNNGDGVPQNFVDAADWYKKSAAQGNADAELDLGLSYQNGTGVPKDDSIAREWLQKSADQGNSDAQAALESMNGHDDAQAAPAQSADGNQIIYPSSENMQKINYCVSAAKVPGGGYCVDVFYGCLTDTFGNANFTNIPVPMDSGFFNQECFLFHRIPSEMVPLPR